MPTYTVKEFQVKELQDALIAIRTAGAGAQRLLEKASLEVVAEFVSTNTMYKVQAIPVWTSRDGAETLVLFRTNDGSRLGILLWNKSVCSSNSANAVTLEALRWSVSHNVFRTEDKPEFLEEIVENTAMLCKEKDIRMVFLLDPYGLNGLVKNTDAVFLEAKTYLEFAEQYDRSDSWRECIKESPIFR